jgi:hypothetical protein
MKKTPFTGRAEELKRLRLLMQKVSASLVVIHGRRRIGKSRLIEEFAKNVQFLRFSGLPPTVESTQQTQRDEFARQLSTQTGIEPSQTKDWGGLLSLLASATRQGRVIILLDEISWMGSKDPQFLGKLKNIWDMEFKQNPELILILCGSVSSWIEKNILQSTGFMGRISLTLFMQELQLLECDQLLNAIGFRGSDYDRFKILSITGGVPRYLEEINPSLPAEANIENLAFNPSGMLFREFKDIFSDLFSRRKRGYQKIVESLASGSKAMVEIAKQTGMSSSTYLNQCLQDLKTLGFIQEDIAWEFKKAKEIKISRFRLSDNYLRFYLKCILPNNNKIVRNQFNPFSSTQVAAWDTIMGLQFENLVLANRNLLWKHLPFRAEDIANDNPYFQRTFKRKKGCQIDYLVQTRYNNLFVCEIKFSKDPIGGEVITDVKEKISCLVVPRGYSCWPVLIHVNGVSGAVRESGYFSQIIDFSELLRGAPSSN